MLTRPLGTQRNADQHTKHQTPNSALSGKLNNVTKVESGVVDTPGTYGEMPLLGELGYVEIALPESVVNSSTSDQEEPESDNDVPYFSDIEALSQRINRRILSGRS